MFEKFPAVALCLGLLLLPSLSFAGSFTGTVVRVPDGDTIKVLTFGKVKEVRLADIDCPEKDQAYGLKARRFTTLTALGKGVSVKVLGVDPHGRTVGEVRLLVSGLNLNRELLQVGLAWWYWKFSDNMELGELELAARKKKVGLWQDPSPVPPWEFREEQKTTR